MAYKDVREFMEALDRAGELVRIEAEVDWKLEVGAILRRSYEIGAPAVHFKKIKGYSREYTVCGNLIGNGQSGIWTKLAIALELDPATPYKKIVEEFSRRISNPIKPIEVKTGPCKENIHLDKEVNLFEFPVPYLHEGDGGRYIHTWGSNITKDPDSDWTNWGMYRVMLHTRNRGGGLVMPHQHIGMMYYQKYEARNKPMPFALAIGTEPITALISGVAVPAGVNEVDIVGALRREPVHLVRCETNDLLVPATSEIVIEGVIMPWERWDEGPFGEFTGYRASPRMPRPVYRVECIIHRDNPILTASCMGVPIDDSHIATGAMGPTIDLEKELREAKFPITSIYCPPYVVGGVMIVSVKKNHGGIAHEVASAIRAHKQGGTSLHYVIVCDEDVDATNVEQVLHALVTKCHPKRGVQIVHSAPGFPLNPFLNLHERQFGIAAAVTFDATWPMEWDPMTSIPQKVSFDSYPSEVQEKVLKDWTEKYGFPED